jgi:hypothetical protein
MTKDKSQRNLKHQLQQAPKRSWNFGLDRWSFFGPCYLSFVISRVADVAEAPNDKRQITKKSQTPTPASSKALLELWS